MAGRYYYLFIFERARDCQGRNRALTRTGPVDFALEMAGHRVATEHSDIESRG